MMRQSDKMQENVLNNAVASVEIEGYSVTDAEKKMCMDFVSGNITKEQFIKNVLERCRV